MGKRSHLFFHLNADMIGSALYAMAKITQNSLELKWVKRVYVVVNMTKSGLSAGAKFTQNSLGLKWVKSQVGQFPPPGGLGFITFIWKVMNKEI